jgi:hypothetical protein
MNIDERFDAIDRRFDGIDERLEKLEVADKRLEREIRRLGYWGAVAFFILLAVNAYIAAKVGA